MKIKVNQHALLALLAFASGITYSFLVVSASNNKDLAVGPEPAYLSQIHHIKSGSVLGARVGVNVLIGNTVYWLSSNGTKQPYPNLMVLQSYGRTLKDVLSGTADEAALPTGAPV